MGRFETTDINLSTVIVLKTGVQPEIDLAENYPKTTFVFTVANKDEIYDLKRQFHGLECQVDAKSYSIRFWELKNAQFEAKKVKA